jgi:hypothetical protein
MYAFFPLPERKTKENDDFLRECASFQNFYLSSPNNKKTT